jgi:DNA polymerase I-like protein with 3'-5' exonuclease and polymerase domains
MNTHQATLLGKVVGKESDAAWSYNGFNKSIAYGYGLKKLVESFFGYKMLTYKELLAQYSAETMEDLTGEQVCEYGAGDAYWVIPVLGRLIEMIRPGALEAFSRTENEMTHVYGELALEGVRINSKAVDERYDMERAAQVEAMALLREAVEEALPFPEKPNAELLKREDWYSKGYVKYRKMVTTWKRDDKKPYNPVHYMQARTILYDLMGLKLILDKGKVQSDGDARGRMLETATGSAKKALEAFNKLAGIDQIIKLYLTPYKALVDPETGRAYPEVTSMLATRRMAAAFPNTTQLANRGECTYVRGFFEADKPTHGILSSDLSQIELVLIGSASGDQAFRDAYGQLPYKDLHTKAAASLLGAILDRRDLTVEDFKALKFGENIKGIPLHNAKGEEMEPKAAYKYYRVNLGKVANFSFWYSGSLNSLAEQWGLGYESVQMLVQAYADAFPEAVAWRAEQGNFVQQYGYLDIPDGHRRVRYEATYEWQALMKNYFKQISQGMSYEDAHTLQDFGGIIINKISRRAVNQCINARIQALCAAIIKRSILRVRKEVLPHFDARLIFPVHDEAVYSVAYDDMFAFSKEVRRVMTDHHDLVPNLVVDSSVSIGRTFQPYDADRAKFGQIELSEAPALSFIPQTMVGSPMDEERVLQTIEYLRSGL